MKGLSALVLAFVVVLSGCRYTGGHSPAGSPADSGSSEVSEKSAEVPEEFSGEWYLWDFSGNSEPQKWEFRSNGVLIAGDEEREWKVVKPLLGREKIYIDGKRYLYSRVDDALYIYKYDAGPVYVLYTTDSEQYLEYMKQRAEDERSKRLTEEFAELFSRYPDNDGWIERLYTGDIPFLADPDIIDRMLRDGFVVSTPEELASCCWYMNTNDSLGLMVTIAGDIDLSGYEWAPMGWSKPHGGYAFRGYVDGGGHTIKNMKMSCGNGVVDIGFIGYGLSCSVFNICFDGAEVEGYNSGIVIGDSICGAMSNVTAVNGSVIGSCAGALVGWDAHTIMENCSADVTVNGEKAEQLSWNESEKSRITVENKVEITLDEDYVVHRPEVTGYDVYSWVIELDGREMYCNSAWGSSTYQCMHSYPGTYKVYLQAWVDGQYMPISNIISYTIE